jgi:AraC-like DNA-binding protein
VGQYTAESLEKKMAWMRERQRKRQAIEPTFVKPLSPAAYERRERVRVKPHMLRMAEVAAMLGVSLATVRRQFRQRAVKLGGCVLIPEQVVIDAMQPHCMARPGECA